MNVNIALLTVTDTRTFDNDKSGAILVEKIKEAKHKLIDRKICKDNKEDIIFCLLYTSPSPRDKRQSRMPSSA